MRLQADLLDSLSRLKLERSPVAIGFLDAPPEGLPRIDRPQPAGCGYWKQASEGHAFYTLPADHENCAVGAFTHGVTLTPEKTKELESLMGTMIELRYLRSDEVAGIPHRTTPLDVVAYAPLDEAAFEPDAVVFRGNPRQIMLILEAARAAGVFESGVAMGRPACAMIPHAASSASGVASVGCIGNRVYTGLGDDELYFTVPGNALARVLEQLGTILTANQGLEAFHRERAAALSA
ncbi:MAG TPA: DUF169 domain-containing protein [Vicinamibacterales bacterium]|jgi:uncharacterized protein (DUF169 family)|nr:DUF169 domain-containing protein [Vicinamibacterales bacterium]